MGVASTVAARSALRSCICFLLVLPTPAPRTVTIERIRRPFDRPTIPNDGRLTRGGAEIFGHSVAAEQQRRQAATHRRKRAGVEPTRSRRAAPTGFEGRPAHRSRFSSVSEYPLGARNWAMNAASSAGSRQRQSSQSRPSREPANHRPRQPAQPRRQRLQRPAADRDGMGRQQIHRQGAGADLAAARLDRDRPLAATASAPLPPRVRRWPGSPRPAGSAAAGSATPPPVRRGPGRAAEPAPRPPAAPCPGAAPASADWR